MSQFVEFPKSIPNPDNPSVRDVSVQEVLEHKEAVKLIDVRRPDEFVGEYGHIPGAELLTLDHLPEKVADIPKDQTIVFICRSGGRSAKATAFALSHGFTSVYNMKGGMIEWTENNFTAEDKN